MTRRAFRSAAVVATAATAACGLMTATSVAAAALPTLTLSVTTNKVVVGGHRVSGAVNIVTTVSGEASDSPSLILLKPGVTAAKFAKVVGKLGDQPFDAIDPYATIVFAGGTDASGTHTSAQAVLPAGHYVAVNNGNGFTPFTISRSSHPASLAKAAATMTAIDFGYQGPTTLHDGELVRFVNAGYLVHMFEWASTPSVADAKKAEADLQDGNVAGAKKFATGMGQFVGPISSGQMQQETITQAPGVYVVFCAMNTEDGREHFQLGMFRTIRIVK
jgi:hypothetical protein